MAWTAHFDDGLTVERDGVVLGPPPVRACLVFLTALAVQPERWISRVSLAQRLYPGADTKTALAALRQSLHRTRLWLGEGAVEATAKYVRLSCDWNCQIADIPAIDHPLMVKLRLARRGGTRVNLFAKMISAMAEADPREALDIAWSGRGLIWQMPVRQAQGLICSLQPLSGPTQNPRFLAICGEFHHRVCRFAQSAKQLEIASRNLPESDRMTTLGARLFSFIELGKPMHIESRWNEITDRVGGCLTYRLARAADLWNQNDLGGALAAMDGTIELLTDASHNDYLHFWTNYSVLAAQAGEITRSLEADQRCWAIQGIDLDERWKVQLALAHGWRELKLDNPERAVSCFESMSGSSAGWRLTDLYRLESLAVAFAKMRDGQAARRSWMRSARIRSTGGAVLNRRGQWIRDLVSAA